MKVIIELETFTHSYNDALKLLEAVNAEMAKLYSTGNARYGITTFKVNRMEIKNEQDTN